MTYSEVAPADTSGKASANVALDPTVGAQLLEDLGFLHVPGPPVARGPAYLFVALRREPTLRHFDPERVDYWISREGRGERACLEWPTRLASSSDFAWGVVRVVDRLSVSNDFLTFGGQLSSQRIDGTRVLVFSSQAPILARGGHSQEWEPGAGQLSAFFARLRAVAGRSPDVERLISQLDPVALYSLYISFSLQRFRTSQELPRWQPRLLSLLRNEQARLRRECADSWTAGERAGQLIAA